jgi:hypothetical protein
MSQDSMSQEPTAGAAQESLAASGIPADDPERFKSPKRGMAAAVLCLQAIVLGLTTPVMISISHVSAGTACAVGLGLAVASLLVAGMLRRRGAYAVGWVLQAASIALGVVVHLMFVLGVIFALLWLGAVGLGGRIERERAAAFAAYDRMQAESES